MCILFRTKQIRQIKGLLVEVALPSVRVYWFFSSYRLCEKLAAFLSEIFDLLLWVLFWSRFPDDPYCQVITKTDKSSNYSKSIISSSERYICSLVLVCLHLGKEKAA